MGRFAGFTRWLSLGRMCAWQTLVPCLVSLTALAVLVLGWLGGEDRLVRLAPDWPAMVPETALALMVAGLGVLSVTQRRPPVYPRVAGALILVTIGMGTVMPAMLPGLRTSDAMSLATVFGLVSLAAALVLHPDPEYRQSLWVEALLTLGAIASSSALIGYMFGVEAMKGVSGFSEIALHSAAALLLLQITLLATVSARGWVAVARDPGKGSAAFRMMLPLVALSILLGGLVLKGLTDWGAITADFRLGMAIVGCIVLVGAASLFFAQSVNREQRESRRLAGLQMAAQQVDQAQELMTSKAQNLQTLGQVVAGVAHDFNNSLAVLRGNLELIELDPTQAQRYLGEAIAATERAAGLTESLLSYGRRARLEPRNAQISTLTKAVLPLFQRVAPANLSVCFTNDLGDDDSVVVDAGAFDSALMNLLINARDAMMPAGGAIRIRLFRTLLTNGSARAFNPPDGMAPGYYVCVDVCDTGPGIAPDDIEKVLQPFFTTKAAGKGSGLGLSSVHGFCRQSGGGLRIRPGDEAEGTCITMAFPTTITARQTQAPPAVNADGDVTMAVDVLLVVPDRRAGRVYRQQLQQQGYSVRVANSPGEALEALDSDPAPAVCAADIDRLQDADLATLRARMKTAGVRLVEISGKGALIF